MPLVPRLYISLLRLAKRIDDNPSYKCFIPSMRGVYYERMSSQWIPLDSTSSTVLDAYGKQNKPLDDLTLLAFRELTRLYTANGMFYHPNKISSPGSHSITTQIKKNFRYSFNDSMDQNNRIDLAFLALRYLSRCVNVASKLTSSSSKSNSIVREREKSAKTLIPSFKLKVGSMLISHPLLYEKDSTLTQSCILIVKHDEMLGSLGVVINSPLHCTLGDRLNPVAMEKNPYLQCFIDCELYAGGDVIADHPVALLHTKPLSIESQQLGNNNNNSVSNDSDTSTDTSPNTSANKSTSSTTTKRKRNSKSNVSRDAHRRSTNYGTIEITFPMSASASSSSSSMSSAGASSTAETATPSTLYFTSDLMWAARDIESGHTKASDFKVIVGYAGWGIHQLQGECDMHSWFIAEGNAIREMAMARTPYGSHQHRDGGGDGTNPTTQSNLTALSPTTQSNLTALSPTTQSNLTALSLPISSSSSHPSSSLQINNGHDLWKNALTQMGGEFSSFSRIIDYNRRDQVDGEHDGNGYHRGGKDKDTIDKDKDKESIDKVMEELYQLSLYGVDIDAAE